MSKQPKPNRYPIPVHLRRVRDHGHRADITLWFEFEGGHARSSRARYSQVKPENMPPFDGNEGWFIIEKVPKGPGHPWPYWRAVQQVEPPNR